ncbi:MAG: hypothetical protein AAFX78_00170 [Cyanobacteria bacterium J06638_20]
MKIIRQTATELVLSDRHLPLFTMLWAFVFMGIPLVIGYSLLRNVAKVELTCDRIEPTLVDCTSTKTPLLSIFPTTTQAYDAVTAADYRVEETTDSEGERHSDHYVVLKTKDGDIPTFQSYVSVNGVRGNAAQAQATANHLNQFLQSQQQSISLQQDVEIANFFALGFVSIFLVVGAAVLHSQVRIVTLKLNKDTNKISRYRFSLLGFWVDSDDLRQLQTVEVERRKDNEGDGNFAPVIFMQSGKKYILGRTVYQESDALRTVNQIRDFLNLR